MRFTKTAPRSGSSRSTGAIPPHIPSPKRSLGLRAFLTDGARQGQGLATAAIHALPAYLHGKNPTAPARYLTVNLASPAAIRAYLNGGFTDTGQIRPHGTAGPQHVMRLPL